MSEDREEVLCCLRNRRRKSPRRGSTNQGPLGIKPEKDKVVESMCKKVIMIQHEISTGYK